MFEDLIVTEYDVYVACFCERDDHRARAWLRAIAAQLTDVRSGR